MSDYLRAITGLILQLLPYAMIVTYPQWEKRSVSGKVVVAAYSCILFAICIGYILVSGGTAFFGSTYQYYRIASYACTGFPLMSFLLFRRRFWENLFLNWMAVMCGVVYMGLGNWAEYALAGNMHNTHPQVVPNLVTLFYMVTFLPPLLHYLRKLFSTIRTDRAPIWRLIWVMPAVFTGYCMLTGNLFNLDHFERISVPLSRILTVVSMTLVLAILSNSLQQAGKAAALGERTRMMEGQLALQSEQYDRLRDGIERSRRVQHDLHHQFSAIKRYADAGDTEGLRRYLERFVGIAPQAALPALCKNYAVNAVASHYLSQARQEGIHVDAQLIVPERLGAVSDADLCILVGNSLENALEACLRMPKEANRFIRARSSLQGEYFVFVVDNSFDGITLGDGSAYLSRKREGMIEGIGLSSIRYISKKYKGTATVSAEGNVFQSSIVVLMGAGESSAGIHAGA